MHLLQRRLRRCDDRSEMRAHGVRCSTGARAETDFSSFVALGRARIDTQRCAERDGTWSVAVPQRSRALRMGGASLPGARPQPCLTLRGATSDMCAQLATLAHHRFVAEDVLAALVGSDKPPPLAQALRRSRGCQPQRPWRGIWAAVLCANSSSPRARGNSLW